MGYVIVRLLEAQVTGSDFLPHWVVTSMLARRKPLLHKILISTSSSTHWS